MPQLTAQQLMDLEEQNIEYQEGETLYEFSLDSDGGVIYRHCGTGKGCFWTGWEPNGQFIN